MSEIMTWNGMLEDNLYRILKTFRKEGLPLEKLQDLSYLKEYRWLCYKKEFYSVLPVLMQWVHAYTCVEINGVASNNIPFNYGDKKPEHPRTKQEDAEARGGNRLSISNQGRAEKE